MVTVILPDGDSGVLDTMTASNQGLLVVLTDGRVLLVDLSLSLGQRAQTAWAEGDITKIVITAPYVSLRRTVMH